MKFSFPAVVAFAAGIWAFPPPSGHEYKKPGPNDVRSPCPGLNSLANHGFLNRSGKNITVPMLIDGGAKGLSMGADFMSAIGFLALFSHPKPNFQNFDLNHLAEHNFPIEHDVSLTRKDFFIDGDDLHFYRPYYNEFMSYFNGRKTTSLATSAAARRNRITYSFKRNPTLVYGPVAFLFGYGESGLYTQTMGMSPSALEARVDYVESLFLHERLPYELGWQPSKQTITSLSLGQFAFECWLASKDPLPIGLEAIGPGTLAQVIATQTELAKKLYNYTHT